MTLVENLPNVSKIGLSGIIAGRSISTAQNVTTSMITHSLLRFQNCSRILTIDVDIDCYALEEGAQKWCALDIKGGEKFVVNVNTDGKNESAFDLSLTWPQESAVCSSATFQAMALIVAILVALTIF